MRLRFARETVGISPGKIAWRKFKRNKVGMTALFFVLFVVFVAVMGSVVTPDQTPFANRQILEIGTMKPGFRVKMLKVPFSHSVQEAGFLHTMIFGAQDRFLYIPLSSYTFSGDSLVAEIFAAGDEPSERKSFHINELVYGADWKNTHHEGVLMTYAKSDQPMFDMLKEKVEHERIEDITYYMGTDQYGRDMQSRLMIGSRVSLSVGFISVFISLLIGVAIGSMGGFYRGWVDDVVVWLINVVWSVPTLLLVIAITFALGKGFWQVFIAVGLTMWVEVARVVRGQMLSIREKEFAEAAVSLGFGNYRIIRRHLLPNVIGPVIVISAANFASAILIEAGLSFLGLGVQPPVPSWGSMIKENYAFIILDAAYLALLPGIAIMLLVLSFMLIGNALREALDVKGQ